MNSIQKTIFIILYKTYKFIKHILYKIFIFPFQYLTWVTLKFYARNFWGWKAFYKGVYKQKILTYIGMMLVLFAILKYTQYILYDPLAYDIDIKWPKRIRKLRKMALVHWITVPIVYTLWHMIGWISRTVHLNFKNYSQTMYYEFWFWFHVWFHGIWWETSVKYMNNGYGISGLIFFTIVNHYFWLVLWGCEFLEDMEYDWDDYFDAYEGAYLEFGTARIYLTKEFKKEAEKRQQAMLDEITSDVFGASERIGDDPQKTHMRWSLWSVYMTPPKVYTDEDLWKVELEKLILDEPYKLFDYYLCQFAETNEPVDPTMREWWWEFWTKWEDFWFKYLFFPWATPLRKFYYVTFRSLPARVIPMRRIRVVGEYSRYNWRYKVWLMKYNDIPAYRGYGEYTLLEFYQMFIHILFILRAFILFCYTSLRTTAGGWILMWGGRKYRKQVKNLQKWGSINYSFFGKQNYKPKK